MLHVCAKLFYSKKVIIPDINSSFYPDEYFAYGVFCGILACRSMAKPGLYRFLLKQ